MARETKAAKAARLSMLMADFDARNREVNKLKKIVEGLKEQLKAEDPGTYGDWVLSQGSPREITDAAAVKQHYADLGIPMPTKMTEPSVIVSMVAGK